MYTCATESGYWVREKNKENVFCYYSKGLPMNKRNEKEPKNR